MAAVAPLRRTMSATSSAAAAAGPVRIPCWSSRTTTTVTCTLASGSSSRSYSSRTIWDRIGWPRGFSSTSIPAYSPTSEYRVRYIPELSFSRLRVRFTVRCPNPGLEPEWKPHTIWTVSRESSRGFWRSCWEAILKNWDLPSFGGWPIRNNVPYILPLAAAVCKDG